MLLSQIIINEVYPRPLTTEKEWVEIIYPASNTASINLSSWSIWDQLSQPSLIYSFSNLTLEPGACYSIEFSNKLNNSTDGVVIKNPDQEIADQMSYDYSETGKSWQRVSLANDQFALADPSQCTLLPSTTLSSTPALSPTQTTTPSPNLSPTTSASSTPTPTPTAIATANNYELQLSEIMACPEEGTEWIELYNSNNIEISLTNWSIWDSLGEIYTFEQETINSHDYISIDVNNKLNNSGDQVILKNGLGETTSDFSYNECIKGTSFIYHQNGWQTTKNPSKNLANIFQQDQDASNSADATNNNQANNQTADQIDKNKLNNDQNKLGLKDNSDASMFKSNQQEKNLTVNKNLSNLKLKIPSNPDKKQTDSIFFNPIQVNRSDILSVIIGGILVSSLGAYGSYAQIYKHNKNPS